MYKIIWYRVPAECIGGNWAVLVRRVTDNKVVSSVTGIRSERDAIQRASDYSFNFGMAGQFERLYHAPVRSHSSAVFAAGAL